MSCYLTFVLIAHALLLINFNYTGSWPDAGSDSRPEIESPFAEQSVSVTESPYWDVFNVIMLGSDILLNGVEFLLSACFHMSLQCSLDDNPHSFGQSKGGHIFRWEADFPWYCELWINSCQAILQSGGWSHPPLSRSTFPVTSGAPNRQKFG